LRRFIRSCVERAIRAAPRDFRERFGTDYLTTFDERMAAAEGRGRGEEIHLGVREVLGALRMVVRLRLELEPSGGGGAKTDLNGGGEPMIRTIWQDTTQAANALRRNPGFTLTAVVVLGLGIGANTAIFSAVNAYFFRPLPFEDPEELVLLYETNTDFGWTDVNAAPANALDWRERVDAFEDVAVYRDFGVGDVTLPTEGDPILVGGTSVSGNFFDVLGVRPALGRGFTWDETWSGEDDVIVLSHALWVSHFGADPEVVGRTIPFGGAAAPVEVIGVMPEGFAYPSDETRLWYPYGWNPSERTQAHFRRAHYVRPVARLADGVSLAEADARLRAVASALQEEYPETNRNMGAGMMPLRDFLVREVRSPLMLLLGAVAILLLLACANVANLMLVRAADRTREMALRRALGGGRAHVVRQLLAESLLIGVLGGAVGLTVGWLGVTAMSTMTRLGIEGTTDLALDGRVVGFTLLLGMLGGMLFGTVPALRGAAGHLDDVLRDGGYSRSRRAGGRGAGGLLVTAEVALALLLVAGAGLIVRSGLLLRNVDPGFQVDRALAIELSVPSARYENRDQVLAFWNDVERRLVGRPGIERAGMVARLPLDGTSWSSQFQAEGWPPERYGSEILHRRADRGYFEALDIPLLRGRLFDERDGPDAPFMVVINETFANEHFPNEDPVGQKIAYDRAATEASIWYEIIGIVGDQRQESPAVPARAEVFENRSQDWGRQGWVVMKTSVDPLSVVPAVRSVVEEMDPKIPLAAVLPLRDVWRASLERERFILVLLGTFGVVALLLATVGVYGVTAQVMRRRTREIGIRMALGAAARDVFLMVLRQGAVLVGGGIVLGLGASLLASRVLTAFLYGIEPNDPRTLISVVALLGTVALAACYLPARKAMTVDPVRSLQAE